MSLLAGLAQGFARGQQQKVLNDEKAQERKLRTKLFELQLQREEREGTKSQFEMEELQGRRAAQAQVEQFTAPVGEPATGQVQKRSLLDMLAENPMVVAKAGLTPLATAQANMKFAQDNRASDEAFRNEQLEISRARLGIAQQAAAAAAAQRAQTQALFQQLAGGASGGNPDGTGAGTPGGLQPSFSISPTGGVSIQLKPDELNKPITAADAKSLVDPNGNPPAPGMTWKQVKDAGFTYRDPVTLTAGDASKVAMIEEGMKAVQSATASLFPSATPDGLGKPDSRLVWEMNAPMGGIGKGREVKRNLVRAVRARLRLESGAAIGVEEAEQMASEFIPTPLDSDEVVQQKVQQMQQFMNGTLEYSNLPASVRTKFKDEGIEDRKTLNGKLYVKIRGEWYER